MAAVTAISSLGWAHYTLYEALPRMAARGFRRVEVASFHSYCFHFNCGSPTPDGLRAMLDERGLEAVCLNFSSARYRAWVPGDADRFVEATARKLRQLGRAGIPMMTMPFGERNRRPDQPEQLDAAARVFTRLGELARPLGVRMLIEAPHLYAITHRPERVLRVLERIESDNVGVLVDSSHWGIIGYEPSDYFARLGDRLWHVHLRDSRGPDTADRRQELELTPGRGSVDFALLARALDGAGYRGDVTLEFEYRDMTLEDIEREFDAGIAHLAACGWRLPQGVRGGPGAP